MGEMIDLRASDGFQLSAYRAVPPGTARGAIVLAQEIFGVNAHIRSVADGYAADGFFVVAPALFDRVEPHFESGYSAAERPKAMEFIAKANRDAALLDITAAKDFLTNQEPLARHARVGVIGYCWGGTLSWLSATRIPGFSAAVLYYGGGVGSVAAEEPHCPVLAHFGEKDDHIPQSDVDKLRNRPNIEVYTYPAGHGFNCDARDSYDAPSAALARQRSLAFFHKHLGGSVA